MLTPALALSGPVWLVVTLSHLRTATGQTVFTGGEVPDCHRQALHRHIREGLQERDGGGLRPGPGCRQRAEML